MVKHIGKSFTNLQFMVYYSQDNGDNGRSCRGNDGMNRAEAQRWGRRTV